MKTYYKIISAILLVSIVWLGCEPLEESKPDLGEAPTAADVTFTATPTAENPNIVRFNNTSPGFKALWNFGNGSTAEGNEVFGEFPIQGEYEITLTIFTRAGKATNSQTINIAETNALMLDREDYNLLTGGANALEGKTWIVDSGVAGHLGVGPIGGTFPEFYQAAPNEKAGEGYYDDELTFKLDGFGVDYANQGSSFINQAHVSDFGGSVNGADQTLPHDPAADMTWSIVDEGPRKFLILSNGGFMSYYTGVSRFEITLLTEDEMHIRQLDSRNGELAWYQKFIRKGFERPVPEVPYLAEDVFDNFDEEGNVTWSVDQIGAFNQSFDNPAMIATNPSAKVARYVKTTAPFDNVYIDLPYKMDITERNVFTMKVFIPSYNDYETAGGEVWNPDPRLLRQVSLKLQNGDLAAAFETQAEVIVPVTQMDNWVEVTFDFSAFADRTDFDRIVLQIGGEGHYNPGIFFVDDFRLQ
ncbi:PKD domain-containing protein [Penaeicola halotolerans]|uniref:PKD domain-containing protein n=1 Tax=Penaeicola halotolerans TaxID=2793196 RepID=UPI001CF8F386|nr:PKD domain-containing protein [Penaeicola halotolerans]